MKPFDIELDKQGHPVCTRDGRDARIICFDAIVSQRSKNIIALVKHTELECKKDDLVEGLEVIIFYDKNGITLDQASDLDLLMKSEKRKFWMLLYYKENFIHNNNDPWKYHSRIYESKYDAEKTLSEFPGDDFYLAEVEIEI